MMSFPVVTAISAATELKSHIKDYLAKKPKTKSVEIEIDVGLWDTLQQLARLATDLVGVDVAADDVAACILEQAIIGASPRKPGEPKTKCCCKGKKQNRGKRSCGC